jgi:hypothetical protein
VGDEVSVTVTVVVKESVIVDVDTEHAVAGIVDVVEVVLEVKVVVDVVDGIGGAVAREGVGRQVETRSPCEKAANPSG